MPILSNLQTQTQTQSAPFRVRVAHWAAIGLLGLATAASAQVRSGTTGIDRTGNTASEVAQCNSGASHQDRERCLLEARNAAAAKRSGDVASESRDVYRANRLQRCEVFKEAETKAACVARVLGTGNAEGSVAGGGVLRQSPVTTVHGAEGADAKARQTAVVVDPQTQRSGVLVVEQPAQPKASQ